MKRIIEKFNDVFAIGLMAGIFGLWAAQGYGVIDLNGTEVIGATIAIATMIAQHYYRKLKGNGEEIPE